jgi:hypothetical protein
MEAAWGPRPAGDSEVCPQGPGPSSVKPSLKNWEWTIYQRPPFLQQEVAPRVVVFIIFFQLFLGSWFGNSKGLQVTRSGPSPLLLGEKTDAAFPEDTLTLNVHSF